MKRLICLMLALLLLSPCLVACGKHTKLEIVAEGACTIIYDVDLVTADQANGLAKRMKDVLGAEVTVKSSSSFPLAVQAAPNTILLGCVKLDACLDATKDLRDQDYIVGVYGQYYVIAGTSATATANAITYFRREVLPDSDAGETKLTVSSKNNYRHDGKYSINNMTIGGVPLYECEIVMPKKNTVSEYRFALRVQELLRMKTGYTLPVVKSQEAATAGQIRIGASICEHVTASEAHSFVMGVSGSVMEITAESLYGYEEARTALQDEVLGGKKDAYSLDDTFTCTGNGADRATALLQNDSDLRLFYNNIWGGTDGDEKQRMSQLVELYLEYMPDVIGLQECSTAMYDAGICKLLNNGYAEVKTSKASPRTPLFYNTETVEVLKSGYLALNTLDFSAKQYAYLLISGVTSAQMKALMDADKSGPDDDSSKSLTWAIFRVKETGHIFFAGSTHLWWQGRHNQDDSARIIQMEVMKSFAVKTAADYLTEQGISGKMPIFIGGDYNSRMSRDSYHSMDRNTCFDNLNDLAPANAKLVKSTMHNYPEYDEAAGLWKVAGSPRGLYDNALDHIFAAHDSIGTYEVVRMAMLEETYAFASSDHSPIFADLNFTDTTPVLAAVQ